LIDVDDSIGKNVEGSVVPDERTIAKPELMVLGVGEAAQFVGTMISWIGTLATVTCTVRASESIDTLCRYFLVPKPSSSWNNSTFFRRASTRGC
jgi:hypothetical protein